MIGGHMFDYVFFVYGFIKTRKKSMNATNMCNVPDYH